MKRILLALTLVILGLGEFAIAQNDSTTILNNTFRSELYASRFGKTQIGGYAQIDYNQPFGDTLSQNGTFDVHRLVIFLGHKFNDRLSFFFRD